ncbi:hypothetical protein EYF80_016711 [Liparis tanakae]|uniref:Uncharacterized protein n=1 Tax=Liparis tanakae TaxID=230148 RepID=A0A4Z2I5J0_9TELE|nr:hypothetical protein EYF80_016711 [Liparis tanakae]
MLEGFKGEPEEDDGVEEAVQTMGPEDLQKRREKDGGMEEEEEEGHHACEEGPGLWLSVEKGGDVFITSGGKPTDRIGQSRPNPSPTRDPLTAAASANAEEECRSLALYGDWASSSHRRRGSYNSELPNMALWGASPQLLAGTDAQGHQQENVGFLAFLHLRRN